MRIPHPALLCILAAICLFSCDDDDQPIPALTAITGAISNIQRFNADVSGEAAGDSILMKGTVIALHPAPTLDAADGTTFDLGGKVFFTVTHHGLLAGHNYFVRAYARTASDTVYGEVKSFFTVFDDCALAMNHHDQWYQTVDIGTQCWMRSGLSTNFYNNHDHMVAWGPDKAAFERVYNNVLYTSYYRHATLTDPRGICPPGYHLPTLEDWEKLANWFGGLQHAGGALKSTGTDHWLDPNEGAINSSGMYVRPDGYAVYNAQLDTFDFQEVGREIRFAIADHPARSAVLRYNSAAMHIEDDPFPEIYKSCRCLNDK